MKAAKILGQETTCAHNQTYLCQYVNIIFQHVDLKRVTLQEFGLCRYRCGHILASLSPSLQHPLKTIYGGICASVVPCQRMFLHVALHVLGIKHSPQTGELKDIIPEWIFKPAFHEGLGLHKYFLWEGMGPTSLGPESVEWEVAINQVELMATFWQGPDQLMS